MKKYMRWIIPAFLALALWLTIAPPRFWLNLIRNVPETAEMGAQLVENHQCRDCHRIEGSGALVGPDLDTILRYESPMVVRLWLHNPKSIKRDTPMPNFHLSDSEVEAIMAYLQSVQEP